MRLGSSLRQRVVSHPQAVNPAATVNTPVIMAQSTILLESFHQVKTLDPSPGEHLQTSVCNFSPNTSQNCQYTSNAIDGSGEIWGLQPSTDAGLGQTPSLSPNTSGGLGQTPSLHPNTNRGLDQTPSLSPNTSGGLGQTPSLSPNTNRGLDQTRSLSPNIYGEFAQTSSQSSNMFGMESMLFEDLISLEQEHLSRRPEVCFVSQPAAKFHFRYLKDQGSHGHVKAATSAFRYPAIQLKNFSGNVEVRVQLYAWDPDPAQRRPNSVVRLQRTKGRGRSGYEEKDQLNDLAEEWVLHVPENIHHNCELRDFSIFKLTKDNLRSLGKTSEEADILCREYNKLSVCLRVTAYQDNSLVAGPIFSSEITNLRRAERLRIHRRSDFTSSVSGGQEMWLITSEVKQDDIDVKVEDDDGWSVNCSQLEVHYQHTVVCRIPPYRTLNLAKPKLVKVYLFRRSDSQCSQPYEFKYLPDPCITTAPQCTAASPQSKKRKYISSMSVTEDDQNCLSLPQYQPHNHTNVSSYPLQQPHSHTNVSSSQLQQPHNHTNVLSSTPYVQHNHNPTTSQTPAPVSCPSTSSLPSHIVEYTPDMTFVQLQPSGSDTTSEVDNFDYSQFLHYPLDLDSILTYDSPVGFVDENSSNYYKYAGTIERFQGMMEEEEVENEDKDSEVVGELGMNDYDNDGYTALHQAVREGDEEAVRELLAAGAQVNLQCKKRGDTALHITARHNFTHLLRLLLDEDDIDLFICNDDCHTFLHVIQPGSSASEVIRFHPRTREVEVPAYDEELGSSDDDDDDEDDSIPCIGHPRVPSTVPLDDTQDGEKEDTLAGCPYSHLLHPLCEGKTTAQKETAPTGGNHHYPGPEMSDDTRGQTAPTNDHYPHMPHSIHPEEKDEDTHVSTSPADGDNKLQERASSLYQQVERSSRTTGSTLDARSDDGAQHLSPNVNLWAIAVVPVLIMCTYLLFLSSLQYVW
ncbi:nuclear factor NF-kappa-B p110 subunit-like [Homarus americanus]|uniref:nuclear factor NF-kappa-B p110 subunit-like n=1 Tax=Homarus americanus TaxID=6706 RepID=UPI001C487FC4|nr:nuclear factor NF-kappa-B p110 subunit-like [Homarus americanus]XP_042232271.1 nuclear factor NF-kappa-B p110 subunit-like [Homarus americanus]